MNRAVSSAPKAAWQHPSGGRAARQRTGSLPGTGPSRFGRRTGFAVRREPAPYVCLAPHLPVKLATSPPRLTQAAVARFVMCQRRCRLPTCTFMFRAPYAPQGAAFSTLGQVRAVRNNALRSRERRFESYRGHSPDQPKPTLTSGVAVLSIRSCAATRRQMPPLSPFPEYTRNGERASVAPQAAEKPPTSQPGCHPIATGNVRARPGMAENLPSRAPGLMHPRSRPPAAKPIPCGYHLTG
jgi:hypothetical protein